MAATGDPLKPYQWTARVLVVSAPSQSDPPFRAQAHMLADDFHGQQERDLKILDLAGPGGPDTAALRERLSLPPDRFEVVLVGKDGTVALRRREPIPLSELFGRIDDMPRRRAELRKLREGRE